MTDVEVPPPTPSWPRVLRELRGPLRPLRERGAWLWLALGIGALARLGLALFTEGTYDVPVWASFAESIANHGLFATYADDTYLFNHPPVAGAMAGVLWRVAEATGLPFAFLLRLPVIAADLGSGALVIALAAGARGEGWRRARFVLGAVYWTCPLAIVLSGYHGNNDPIVACLLAASVLCVARQRPLAAGALLGLSLWIKLPGIAAGPLLFLAWTRGADRVRFGLAAAAVGLVGYGPALWVDGRVIVDSVFLYQGLRIQTTSGIPVWGLHAMLPDAASLPGAWQAGYQSALRTALRWNTVLSLAPVALLAWLRRGIQDSQGVARGLALSYSLLYGLSNAWSFQYLAWSLPFWLLACPAFASCALLLSTGYVWGLYGWLTGGPWLTGPWDFVGKPAWPPVLIALRNACVLFFAAAGLAGLGAALRDELRRQRDRLSGS